MEKVVPLNEEVKLANKRYLVSETDAKGVITYCNDYFTEVSGYKREELIGKQHNIIRHPDMPKVVFKLLWERIQSGKNVNAIVKNLAKNGKYYWIFTEFKTRIDLDTNTVIGYTAHRKTISHSAIDVIAPLYAKLVKIENEKDIESAQNYLTTFFEEKGKDINFVNFLDHVHKFY